MLIPADVGDCSLREVPGMGYQEPELKSQTTRCSEPASNTSWQGDLRFPFLQPASSVE